MWNKFNQSLHYNKGDIEKVVKQGILNPDETNDHIMYTTSIQHYGGVVENSIFVEVKMPLNEKEYVEVNEKEYTQERHLNHEYFFTIVHDNYDKKTKYFRQEEVSKNIKPAKKQSILPAS